MLRKKDVVKRKLSKSLRRLCQCFFTFKISQGVTGGLGQCSWYSDSLRVERSGNQIQVGGGVNRIIPDLPVTHTFSCTMDNEPLSRE
jgi:hypothetical protein